ncbi:MAG: response regulator [Terriglobales bacterium]
MKRTSPVRPRTRILFVDDEPGIRLTLPAILEQHGFDVTSVERVSDALRIIGTQEFDALISDLNIGEPGDGFTVVSAMRRTQPRCVNFILTGYPAFETALQAIRSQVDDYLVKPADVRELVDLLENKLSAPRATLRMAAQPLGDFLGQHVDKIMGRALEAMKNHPRLAALRLADSERTDHIPELLDEIIRQLHSAHPDHPSREVSRAGAIHGDVRRRQGYTQEMLVDDTRILDSSIFACVQDHFLHIDLSNLIPDLSRLNDGLEAHLQASLTSFHAEKVA